MNRTTVVGALVFCSALASVALAGDHAASQPVLVSVFPLGARRGATCQVEVRGKGLQEVSKVWFECDDVAATVKQVVELKRGSAASEQNDNVYLRSPEDAPTHRVVLEVTVDRQAELGLHGLRLVTPAGMSNGLALQVVPEPVVTDEDTPHARSADARALEIPGVVHGKIERKGELDFFSLEVDGGERLRFQVFSNFRPGVPYRAKEELALFDPAGSWFDPARANRINVSGPVISWRQMSPLTRWFESRDFTAEFVVFPQLTHRFERPGRYLLSVGAFVGAGAADHFYQLRVVRAGSPCGDEGAWFGHPAHPDPGDWLERDSSTLRQWESFSRRLEPTRLQQLRWRAPPAATPSPSLQDAVVAELAEAEPNDRPEQSAKTGPPVIVQGKVDRPGDVDWFALEVTDECKLAFEVETPSAAPPHFNPWIRIVDADGHVLCANMFREYGGDGDDVIRFVERKTLFTFPGPGTYFLQVRDLTSREGGPEFQYRVLVRPQVPHLGRIEVNLDVVSKASVLLDQTDHINLEAGKAREIVVVCEKEEGLDGDIAISATNLPPGVELLSSTPSPRTEAILRGLQYRPLNVQVMDPNNYRADRCAVTLVLYARPDALATRVPQLVTVTGRPIVEGRTGAPLPAMKFPLMVIRGSDE